VLCKVLPHVSLVSVSRLTKKMAKTKDLAGQRFGRLTVLYDTGKRKNGHVVWHCQCDCGNELDIRSDSLVFARTTSCGCYKRQRTAEVHTVHGMARGEKRHSIYWIWHSMLQRCENPSNEGYRNYGFRGIKVCDEWHKLIPFCDWALASGWQKGLQLDRINNNGNYEPGNCRWATPQENSRNKRDNRMITFAGKTQCLAAWVDDTGIEYDTLRARINRYRWPIERALTEFVKRHNKGGDL